jgi:hypothetical protein
MTVLYISIGDAEAHRQMFSETLCEQLIIFISRLYKTLDTLKEKTRPLTGKEREGTLTHKLKTLADTSLSIFSKKRRGVLKRIMDGDEVVGFSRESVGLLDATTQAYDAAADVVGHAVSSTITQPLALLWNVMFSHMILDEDKRVLTDAVKEAVIEENDQPDSGDFEPTYREYADVLTGGGWSNTLKMALDT